MNGQRYFTKRDIVVSIGTLLISLIVIAVFIEVFGLKHGYFEVVVSMVIVVILLLVDRGIIFRRLIMEHESLAADKELKDILYTLLEKTATYDGESDIYNDILKAAIAATRKGDSGSIIDLRNSSRIKYVAVEGFDREILENIDLGYKDTYLYKETQGKMDRTIIIKNSVNYNKLHANDDLVQSLIEAGTAVIRSTLCTPVRVQGKVIGMINIDSTVSEAFNNRDVHIIEIFAMEVGKMIRYYEIMKDNVNLSRHDALTGIYNRGYFYELHRKLYGEDPEIPYVFITTDIDNLKEVNDAYGHQAGDELIRHFVDGISLHIDETAVFGRFGGDEFNILLPKRNISDARAMMARVGTYFKENPINIGEVSVTVSYSYGMIRYPDDETDYEKLIVMADKRMYAQKKSRKDLH